MLSNDYGPVNHFYEDKLPVEMLTVRNPAPNMYQLKDGMLELKVRAPKITETKNPSYWGIRQTSMNHSAETMMRFTPGEGEEAGIVILQSDEANLRLTYGCYNGIKMIRAVRCEGGVETIIAMQEIETDCVTFRFRQRNQKVAMLARINHGEETQIGELVDTHYLSTERAGGFVGCTIGMYASGNGMESENVARFGWLSYQNLRS